MNSARQLGSGLLYALISVVLVVGGLSLALAEGGPGARATGVPTLTVPATSSTTLGLTLTPTPVALSATPSVTALTVTPTASPTATMITPSATAYVYVQPSATFRPAASSTRPAYATSFPCGPYYGWVRNYIVRPGDTLFRIATLYGTTVNALQIANCKPTAVIFAGERLWVPNIATITPGVTFVPIPTFATSTPFPTEPLTLTPFPTEPLTLTPIPTDIPTETVVVSP